MPSSQNRLCNFCGVNLCLASADYNPSVAPFHLKTGNLRAPQLTGPGSRESQAGALAFRPPLGSKRRAKYRDVCSIARSPRELLDACRYPPRAPEGRRPPAQPADPVPPVEPPPGEGRDRAPLRGARRYGVMLHGASEQPRGSAASSAILHSLDDWLCGGVASRRHAVDHELEIDSVIRELQEIRVRKSFVEFSHQVRRVLSADAE